MSCEQPCSLAAWVVRAPSGRTASVWLGGAGIGTDHLRIVPHDENFAMRPDALAEAIAADRAAGLVPFWVCATVGTTNSLAIDPVRAVAEVARAEGVWLHVDAAYGGCFTLTARGRAALSLRECAAVSRRAPFPNPCRWLASRC